MTFSFFLIYPNNISAQPRPMADIEGDQINSEFITSNLILIIELRDQIKLLTDEINYSQALPLALRLSEILASEYGTDSEVYIQSIMDLALIQRNLGLYEESNQSLYQVLEFNFSNKGSFAESNILPLQIMAANYNDMGDFTSAFSTFEDARLISRRTLGLLNTVQLDIMRYQANILLRDNKNDQGIAHQTEAYRTARRISANDQNLRIDFLYEYAEWYFGVNQYEVGRVLLIEALDIIRSNLGENSPNLIRTYRELGSSYRRQQLNDQNGLGYLMRADRLIEDHYEQVSALDKALVYRELGDWYTAFSRVSDGLRQYGRAWEVSKEGENYLKTIKDWFNKPIALITYKPNGRGLTTADNEQALAGLVIADYVIDERGRTQDINIIESNPLGFKDGTVYASIRDGRYRPKMIDSVSVKSEPMTETFSFFYVPRLSQR
jgi:tetratricopeptide (TPR) repeat protein